MYGNVIHVFFMESAYTGTMKTYDFTDTIHACYIGYITQAIVNNLAPLLFVLFMDRYGISLEKITFLTTFNFLTQLCVDLLSAKFVDRIGYRTSAVAAHVFCMCGLVLLAVLPSVFTNAFPGLLTACIFYAVGGGLIEVIISPIVEASPSEHKASAMSLLHSFYCWGSLAVILCSTLLLRLFGAEHWQILPLVWALVPALNIILFCKVPIRTLNEGKAGMGIRNLLHSPLFLVFFVLMIASGASELAMSQWASAFAEKGLGVSKTIGDLAGPCMFALLMGCSRLYYGKMGEKLDLLKYIRISSLLCLASYLLASLSANPVIALCGCGLCGLSVGILWPGVFSLASQHMPKGGTAMFALLSLAGDLGCTAGPTLVGQVSAACNGSLTSGLCCAVVFPLVLIIALALLGKTGKQV